MIESPIKVSCQVFHEANLSTQFNSLYVSIALILPLIGITQSFYLIIGIAKGNLVLQIRAEEVGTQLIVLAIVIAREVETERLLGFQIRRFPYAGRTRTEVQVLGEAVRSTETGTHIGTKYEVGSSSVLDGYTGIDARLIELGLREITIKHDFA